MKGTYLRLSIVILTCVTIAIVLCRESLFITDKDKFILEGSSLERIDIGKTGPDIVVPEKVGDDVIDSIYFAAWWAAGIESLDVSNVKELDYFTLWLFQAGDQSKLKRLDFSKNKKLSYVSVNDAKALNEIIFSESCETIYIKNTAIKEIDLKDLKKLENFTYCDGPLEELDVSNNPNLQRLRVENTNVEAIDVSNNPNLQHLELTNTNVKVIDVSNNPNLQWLEVINTNVKVIDVSNNPILEYIKVNEGVQIIGNTNARIDYVDEELAKRIKED